MINNTELKITNEFTDYYKDFLNKKHKWIQEKIKEGIDLRMTDNGYFNLDGYLIALGIDWTQCSFSLIINAPRNIGKSFNSWDWIEKNIWIPSDYTLRIAYLRTNLVKLKSIRESFNEVYKNKYYMSEHRIYKLALDEEGNILPRNKWTEIGAILGVNNYLNYKSNWFNNYAGIFWDEYNEIRQQGIWTQWLDLFKTIKRKAEPFFVFLVGNKMDGDNDILINLEIDLPSSDDGEDYIQHPSPSIYFVDISMQTFYKLEFNYTSMVNEWAEFNTTTDRYLNKGGYVKQRDEDIILYKNIVKDPNYKVVRNLAFRDFKFEMGTFDNDKWYIHQIDKFIPDKPLLALDNMGYILNKKSKRFTDTDFYVEFAKKLKYKIKHMNLFFTSYDAKDILLDYILLSTELFDK